MSRALLLKRLPAGALKRMLSEEIKINRRIVNLLGSATLAVTSRANELKAQGKDVVNFGAGEPDFDTPDSIKEAGIEAIRKGITKYTPSVGTVELRTEIARKFKVENGLDYKPGQIVVSCGAKHSIFNLIQVLIDDGDEVLIPTPYWVSYPEMVKASGGVTKFLPTTPQSKFKVTAQQLDQAIGPKTKLFLLTSPSNPTGMVYSRKEMEEIARVCVKRNIFVLSDEIYEKMIYDGETFTSFASLGPDVFERTITVNGVSKAYSMTGWRIGYAAGPQPIMSYIQKFQDHSTSNPTSISQYAALQALREPQSKIQGMIDEFKKRRDIICQELDQIAKVSYVRPQGAFYVFCDFSKINPSSDALAKKILDDVYVAVVPGESFGAPGFVRFSFATSVERIQTGVRRIAEWVKTH